MQAPPRTVGTAQAPGAVNFPLLLLGLPVFHSTCRRPGAPVPEEELIAREEGLRGALTDRFDDEVARILWREPERVSFRGGRLHDLDLTHTPLAVWPEGLTELGGSLSISRTQVTALPTGLRVGGDLWLHSVPIAALPAGLKVGGSLGMHGTGVTALPSDLRVGGDLWLSGSLVTTLPEGLVVTGDLVLDGAPISVLPDGLTVTGDLSLRNTLVARLPEGLSVGRTLDLSGSRLSTLPAGLRVGGCLFLSGTRLGEREALAVLSEPGLSAAAKERGLRSAGFPDLAALVSRDD